MLFRSICNNNTTIKFQVTPKKRTSSNIRSPITNCFKSKRASLNSCISRWNKFKSKTASTNRNIDVRERYIIRIDPNNMRPITQIYNLRRSSLGNTLYKDKLDVTPFDLGNSNTTIKGTEAFNKIVNVYKEGQKEIKKDMRRLQRIK